MQRELLAAFAAVIESADPAKVTELHEVICVYSTKYPTTYAMMEQIPFINRLFRIVVDRALDVLDLEV